MTNPGVEALPIPYIFDGHNDFPWAMRDSVEYDLSRADPRYPLPAFHTDIPRLVEGRVGAQFWSLWVPSDPASDALRTTLEQLDFVRKLVQQHPEHFTNAVTAGDVEAARKGGTIASLMGIEGGHSIDNSLAALRIFRELGVGYMTLTHTKNNDWADSATDDPRHGGLAPFGRIVVAEMERLGMLVDLSHVAESVMGDVFGIATRPVIFSHSSAKAICDVPRNVSDEMLSLLRINVGVCMVTFVPQFLSRDFSDWYDQTVADAALLDIEEESPAFEAYSASLAHAAPRVTIDDAVTHIEHVRDVAGIDSVGIGGDFDGTPSVTEGLEDVSCYPALFERLRDRHWSEEDLARVAHGNILRVIRAAH